MYCFVATSFFFPFHAYSCSLIKHYMIKAILMWFCVWCQKHSFVHLHRDMHIHTWASVHHRSERICGEFLKHRFYIRNKILPFHILRTNLNEENFLHTMEKLHQLVSVEQGPQTYSGPFLSSWSVNPTVQCITRCVHNNQTCHHCSFRCTVYNLFSHFFLFWHGLLGLFPESRLLLCSSFSMGLAQENLYVDCFHINNYAYSGHGGGLGGKWGCSMI